MSNLGFRQLAPFEDEAVSARLVAVLSEALASEGLGLYFARRSPEVAQRLWAELLRLVLAAGGPTSTSSQLFFLSDRTTAAVMQRWPEDRPAWHSYGALLRLAKIAPFGKWRALREALIALDKQKAAFADSHGPFLYLAAIGTQSEYRSAGLGSMLLDHLERVADSERRFIYTEATSEAARAWLKKQGFFELLRHVVRPHAPVIYVMVRRPKAPQEEPAAPAAAARHEQSWTSGGHGSSARHSSTGAAASSSAAAESGSGTGGAQPQGKARPPGSVRSSQ